MQFFCNPLRTSLSDSCYYIDREKGASAMWNIINMDDENEYKLYEDFVSSHENGSFTQSLHWTDVKSNWGSEAVIVRDDEGKVRGAALILIKKLPLIRKSFFYCPHGPVYDFGDSETFGELMEAIGSLAKKYRAYQLKIDPCITQQQGEYIEQLTDMGFRFKKDAPELSTIQARNNYMLFFRGRSLDEIFNSFHSKWRYNIRLSQRRGVECKVCGKEALDDFYPLMEETGRRDGFLIRGKSYFSAMLDGLGEYCRLYMCYCDGEPISGAVCVNYAGKSGYVYGASTVKMRNAMPNYLMQWTMISDAVKSGCTVHDFMGIPFYTDENHRNYGVYRFKKGFNGEVVTYAGEFTYKYDRFLSAVSEAVMSVHRQIRRLQTWVKQRFTKQD